MNSKGKWPRRRTLWIGSWPFFLFVLWPHYSWPLWHFVHQGWVLWQRATVRWTEGCTAVVSLPRKIPDEKLLVTLFASQANSPAFGYCLSLILQQPSDPRKITFPGVCGQQNFAIVQISTLCRNKCSRELPLPTDQIVSLISSWPSGSLLVCCYVSEISTDATRVAFFRTKCTWVSAGRGQIFFAWCCPFPHTCGISTCWDAICSSCRERWTLCMHLCHPNTYYYTNKSNTSFPSQKTIFEVWV